MMFNPLKTKKLAIILSLFGTILGLAPVTVAQSIDQVDKNTYQNNEQDPNGSELGNFMNPLNLMHRANLERSRSGGEFAEDTLDNLSEAAKSFKEAQRQMLEAQEAANQNQEPQ